MRLVDEIRELTNGYEDRKRAAQEQLKAEKARKAAEWELNIAREAKDRFYPEIIMNIRTMATSGLSRHRYVLSRGTSTPTNYFTIIVPVLTRLLEADGFTVSYSQDKATSAPGMNTAVAAGLDNTEHTLTVTW